MSDIQGCNISVHVRCINHVHVSCSQQTGAGREESQLAPLRMC